MVHLGLIEDTGPQGSSFSAPTIAALGKLRWDTAISGHWSTAHIIRWPKKTYPRCQENPGSGKTQRVFPKVKPMEKLWKNVPQKPKSFWMLNRFHGSPGFQTWNNHTFLVADCFPAISTRSGSSIWRVDWGMSSPTTQMQLTLGEKPSEIHRFWSDFLESWSCHFRFGWVRFRKLALPHSSLLYMYIYKYYMYIYMCVYLYFLFLRVWRLKKDLSC